MKPIHSRRYSNPPTTPKPMTRAERDIAFFVIGLVFAMTLDVVFRGLGA